MSDIDCKYTTEITCPYCGYKERDSWEAPNEDDERECGDCGEVFEMERNIAVSYCTYKKGEEHD